LGVLEIPASRDGELPDNYAAVAIAISDDISMLGVSEAELAR
jgi:hypothetical protein